MTNPVLSSRRHQVLIALLLAVSLVPIWTTEYFPSQNGPWQVLMAQMMREYSNTAFNYSTYYQHSWHAIPHLLHTLAVYVLSYIMPVLIAHKTAISIYVVLFPLSVFAFLGAIHPGRAVFGYASFLFVYNLPLLRGYHDYCLGLPIVFFTYAYWLRHRDALNLTKRSVIAALTVLVYFSHIFNLCVLGLAMLVTALWERRSVRAAWDVVSLFVVPALLLAEYAWFSTSSAHWIDRSERVFLTPVRAAEAFFSRFFYTLSFPAYVVSVVALLVWSVLIFKGISVAWRAWRENPAARPMLTAPILLALMTAMYFAAPYKFLGWHYVNVRFVPYVLVFALACAVPIAARQARVFTATMALAAVVSHALLSPQFGKASDIISEYVSGADVVELNKTLLPVSFSGEEVGDISPVAHAVDYYQVFRGGANGWGMAQFNTVTPLVYRRYPVRSLFPALRKGSATELAAVTGSYDYVLLWEDPGNTTRLLSSSGFDVIHEQGRLTILRNRARWAERTADEGSGKP